MKNKKLWKSSFLIFLIGTLTVAFATITGINNSNVQKLTKKENFVLTIPDLEQAEIANYQNNIPTWAKTIQIPSTDNTSIAAISISELFITPYSTYEAFEQKFFNSSKKLIFTKSSCETLLKETYRNTNNCAFFAALLTMDIQRKALEGDGAPSIFIKEGTKEWIINPIFFKEDEDKDDRDDTYLVLNYQKHKILGFTKEDITAIPYALAFNIGAKGISASDFSLTTFPTASPESDSAIINLEGNPISIYPSDALTTQNIKYLNLSNTSLGSLQQDKWPRIFSNVEDINLQNNLINGIPVGFLGSMTSLKKLRLSNDKSDAENANTLTSLPSDFSSIAGNLEYLGLANNRFTSNPIASTIANLTSLKVLNLTGNQITALGSLSGLGNTLEELYLKNINLSSLGTNLDSLTKLKILDVSDNSLTTFPSSLMTNLTNLQYLKLSQNNITNLPSISSLTELITFSVYNNENLVVGTDFFINNLKLRNLDLSNTKIDVAHLKLSQLPLFQISFNSLDLTEVPEQLYNISTLERVNFASNDIKEVKLSPYWKRVNYLDNNIATISPFAMPSMDQLITDIGNYSFLNWTDNLEAIIFDYSRLNWSKMRDPRILKVRIPFFWSRERLDNFYSSNENRMVNRPVSSILLDENIDRKTLPDILPTTLEFELLQSTAKAELNRLNSKYQTEISYSDIINNDKLSYSFTKTYQPPDQFNSINDYTIGLQAAIKVAFFEYKDSYLASKSLNNLVDKKNSQSNDQLNNEKIVIILVIVIIIFGLIITSGALLYKMNKEKKLVKGESKNYE